ncbi:hypothetical protein J2S97_003730 [Arthrobacter oryzae]|nr:hypothetical protein [Arthrobacter oryzae]
MAAFGALEGAIEQATSRITGKADVIGRWMRLNWRLHNCTCSFFTLTPHFCM